jgi:hypothetical protein
MYSAALLGEDSSPPRFPQMEKVVREKGFGRRLAYGARVGMAECSVEKGD